MPIARYQIRNEHTLADPELYRAADKDDPEALLEAVAMTGLVGLLRQLGDLAEFAAEIFHDLHEEVMVTAERGHGLMARVQQLEAEVPSLEKAFLTQTHHLSFFSNRGIDWHPNLQSEHNLISCGDLPRFVRDSYEECRGPPQLFLLDKFDVAGAGACLKRYTDPSFFKMESASPGLAAVEVHREKTNHKIKKKEARLRNGENPEVAPTHAKLHQLLLVERIENACSNPARHVKLKNRQLNGSAVEGKSGKSYMEKFLESPSLDHKVTSETSFSPHLVRLMSDDTGEAGIKILEINTIRPVKMSLGNEITCSWTNDVEVVRPSSKMHREMHEQGSAGVTDEMSLNHRKAPDEAALAVDEQKKTENILDSYHSDDLTSEVDNYLDALAIMKSELETNYEYRPKNSSLHIQKLTDSDDKEHQLQARFSYSQSFGDSSTSDEISSFKRDINEEHAELQGRLSDSQSGTSFASNESSSLKRDRNEKYTKLHAQFSEFQYIGNSSLSDVNSPFNKDISCCSYSDCLNTMVENIQSGPILLQSTKNNESEIEDTSSNQFPQIVETQKTDCGEFFTHDGTHDKEEEISGTGKVSSSSYQMKSEHDLLYSDLAATSTMKWPTGNRSEETPTGPIESMDAIPDALSKMKVVASPAVASEKYPLNKLNDGDQSVSYDATLQISNDLELASVDESSNHSKIKGLQTEPPNENCSEILVCSKDGTEGEHLICSSREQVDLHLGTTLLLDGQASKAADRIIASHLNSEDLSHDSPQDESDSTGVEVKCYDQQSNFEEISKIKHDDDLSGSTCNVDEDEDDSHVKDSSSADYSGQDYHVPGDDVVSTKVQSEDQAVSVSTAENDASLATCPTSSMISSASRNLSILREPIPGSLCYNEMEEEPHEVESTKIAIDWNAEKMENQHEPSNSNKISSPNRNLTNLDKSCSTFDDPDEKQMEINGTATAELETQKVVHQPDAPCAAVQLSLNRSVPCDNSEICNGIQDSSPKEKTQHSSSVDDIKFVPGFSKLNIQESECISVWQNKLLQNGKDGLSLSSSNNQLKCRTHIEQLLQSQVSQQDAACLLRYVENSSSEKLQSEPMQRLNHLEEEKCSYDASRSAPEIYLNQHSSFKSLSQSAGQEVNHTKPIMNESLPLLPNCFSKPSEISFEEMPPMPPLPPMQWRTGKVPPASFASHREVIEVSQASFQSIQPINGNEKAHYGSLTSERETLQYQNLILPVMAVEGEKLLNTSVFSVGRHPVAMSLQLPITLNEANSQYNYLVLERSQIQNPFLTSPVPVVSTSKPPHGYIVASEGDMVQNSKPSPSMPPIEHASSGKDPISPPELSQQPSQLMTEPSLEVKTLQQSTNNLEGEGDPSLSPMSPPSMENVQPNHNLLPSESEVASTLDMSALASDFERENLNGKLQNKLPRPRSPLIDAVAAHDKSKLRKVAERVRPQIAPKVEERDSLLEQIRTKSFNLKPAARIRPHYHHQVPRTNLKVAAILEKANAIRQALAGSDEDDDVNSWSDS